ncbi:MAG: cobalamin B12-binding domain-containing protein, partial [Pseudomonadota bacterium]
MFFSMYSQLHHLRQSGRPQVLLVNAEDNHHVLGIRMLEFMLMLHQVSTYTVFPVIPTAEVFKLIQELNPPIVGISVSLGIQMHSVRELLELVKNLEPPLKPQIYIGGQSIRLGLNPQLNLDAKIIHNVKDFLKEAGIV